MQEKKQVRSGAPFVVGAAGVLVYAVVFGIASWISYLIAAAVFAAGFAVGKKRFPDREVFVEKTPKSGDAAADAMILEGRAQLKQIRALGDQIFDPALSVKITSIEESCRQILARLEEQPAMLSSLRTFLRYYLPTTIKLLDARAKLENGATTATAQNIRVRISDALGVIDTAFKKQLAALDEFRFLNLESEMDVLKDLLKADGLIQDDAPAQEVQQATDVQSAADAAQGGNGNV